MSSACREYFPDAALHYEPEYRTPVNWEWLDAIEMQVREERSRTRAALFQGLQLLPNIKGQSFRQQEFEVPQRAPSFVPQPKNKGAATTEEARAMLGWGVRIIEESCQILEADPHTGSWDIDGAILRLKNLRRDFRRREKGWE